MFADYRSARPPPITSGMRRAPLLVFMVLAALVAAPPAAAEQSPLWATVNVCDTAGSPNAMGVRASMPGNGSAQRMYMRFSATWYSRSKQAWYPVAGEGRSDWIYVGRADVRARQAGYTFEFSAPQHPGSTFIVRGAVEMEWRKVRRPRTRRGRRARRAREIVVRKSSTTTRNGIENVGVGDPPGTSEGLCVIS